MSPKNTSLWALLLNKTYQFFSDNIVCVSNLRGMLNSLFLKARITFSNPGCPWYPLLADKSPSFTGKIFVLYLHCLTNPIFTWNLLRTSTLAQHERPSFNPNNHWQWVKYSWSVQHVNVKTTQLATRELCLKLLWPTVLFRNSQPDLQRRFPSFFFLFFFGQSSFLVNLVECSSIIFHIISWTNRTLINN